jgi:hypothetical protein
LEAAFCEDVSEEVFKAMLAHEGVTFEIEEDVTLGWSREAS